ncbi:hypothetical protein Q5Y75_24615 [Ruegeria sp. 2205SS24-7]|uniref:hypothetical protein n=1 Tax=Ruegeria discodermiae TaxID=3064389 RepID=UPI002742031F|nr:hypothetical protein [Ruegeria sp. 2205SS24-7]MDP5220375.1 hypothetical protein [Ruegeria sp. 2205SS24-7]
MSELETWREKWPVPNDGKPLKTVHLRGLALGTLAQAAAGIGRLGWGLALPFNSASGAANIASVGGGKVEIDALSVVLPQGVYVRLARASAALPARGEQVLGLVWTLPDHAPNENLSAQIQPELKVYPEVATAAADGATVLAEIRSAGKGRRRVLRWIVPVLEPGATPETAAAGAALADAMRSAAVSASAHDRYEWQSAAVALRMAASQPAARSTAAVVDDISRALGEVLALVRAAASKADKTAQAAAAKLADLLEAVPTEPMPDAITNWYAELAAAFAPHGPLMSWLRGKGTELRRLPGYPRANAVGRRLDRFDVALATRVLVRLRLRDRAPPRVLVQVDDAPLAPIVLSLVPGGFEAVLSLPETAQQLELELPVEAEVELRETAEFGGDES